MRKIFTICMAILCLNAFPQALNGTYTIGGTNPDYPTINDAVTALKNNGISGSVTFNIRTGVYDESVVIPAIAGTSSNDTIIFQSETQDTADVTIMNSAVDSAHNYTIYLNNAGCITFQYLTIRSALTSGGYGVVIRYDSVTKYITVQNCHVIGKDGTPADYISMVVFMEDNGSFSDTGLVFHNNYIEEGSFAFRIRGCVNCEFTDNYVDDNSAGTTVYTTGQTNCLIRGNRFPSSLNFYYNAGAHKIYKNKFDGGVDLYNCSGTSSSDCIDFYNNMLTNRLLIRGGAYHRIYNNTVYNPNNYAFSQKNTTPGLYLVNNIFISVDNNDVFAVEIENSLADIDTVHHNILYTNYDSIGSVAGTVYNTLADMQAGTNLFQACYDTLMEFASETDLHLCRFSALNFFGENIGLNDDFDGDIRPVNSTIGADHKTPPLALPFIGNDTSVCPDAIVNLSIQQSYPAYLWYDASTNNTLQFSSSYEDTTLNVWLTVFDDNGCERTDTINITTFKLPNVNINPSNASACDGDSVLLTASSGGTSQWYKNGTAIPGANTNTYYVSYAGVYNMIKTNTNGCSDSSATGTVVTQGLSPVIDLGDDTTICVNHTIVLYAAPALPGTYSYLWSDGSTLDSLVVDSTGIGAGSADYSVITTNTSSNCSTTDTVNITFDPCTGINEINNNLNITIHPNPSSGKFIIDIQSNNKETELKIINVFGQVIYFEIVTNSSQRYSKEIDLSTKAKGVYFIHLMNDRIDKVEKVVIH